MVFIILLNELPEIEKITGNYKNLNEIMKQGPKSVNW